ncbi:MAG: type II toxin-antitoxin system ParD family antitoxin [Hyphomicrobiales bacterium]
MATMNISLPDQMRSWVEDCVRSGRYANASDYVRDLIRRDKDREVAVEQIQQMITEGIASGVSEKSVDEVWAEVKSRRVNG